MAKASILEQLGRGQCDVERCAMQAGEDPETLAYLFEGLTVDKAAIKYGCEKILRRISETNPQILYPRIDLLVELMRGEQTILKWGAILIIGNLARVDTAKKIDRILEKYLAPIGGPVMITAGNVLAGGAKIAQARPDLADRIARKFLAVEHANYKTTGCRHIAIGHAITAFDQFFDGLSDKSPVIRFVERQIKNPRNATRKKAEKFLRKHST